MYGGLDMNSAIDTRGLREEDVQLLKQLAGLLRDREEAKKRGDDRGSKKIVLGKHRSTVIGSLSREEIYEHL